MKRKDLVELNNVLHELSGEKHKVKFSFFVARNINKIKPEIDAIIDVNKPCDEKQEYEKKRLDLCEKYAEKDENGRAKISNKNEYVMGENQKIFNEEMEKLKEEREIADKLEKDRISQFEEMLDEEVEFDGYKIKIDNLPEEIKPSFLNVFLIADIIIDD